MTKILAINLGSSSLKSKCYDTKKNNLIAEITISKINLNNDKSCINVKLNRNNEYIYSDIKNHEEAINIFLHILITKNVINDLNEIIGIGHRIAHGGNYFKKSVLATTENVNKITQLAELAPQHIPINLLGYQILKKLIPSSKHIFVFDTKFHQTIPLENYLYPIPYDFYEKYQIRKYGAHGINYEYVTEKIYHHTLNEIPKKIIICHLGNGSSIAAIKNGKCIDTSMGFTPLAGVMMGTRCGDIDPSIIPFLCHKLNKNSDEILEILQKNSGILGVSGISSDMSIIEKKYHDGDKRAIMTSKLYSHIIAKYIGSYFVELGGCNILAFTGGIGENVSYIRQMIVDELSEALNVFLDKNINNYPNDNDRIISSKNSKITIMIIHADEESKILDEVRTTLNI